MALGIGEKELVEAVLLGKEHFQLPVIYVTKKWDGAYPLHVKRLSERLQGTAHVLKETDPKLGELLRKSCDGEIPIMEPLVSIILQPPRKIKRFILNPIQKKFYLRKSSI